MTGTWTTLDLAGIPQAVRPETDWLDTLVREQRHDRDPLWFSLQLSPAMARQLLAAFSGPHPPGPFDPLVARGARMAPATRAALALTIATGRATIGTDILVPRRAFATLAGLAGPGIAISDAGLAIDHPDENEGLAGAAAPPEGGPTPAGPAGPDRAPPPDAVIVAIVDDGVAVANDRFRAAADRTRVQHFLDLATPWTPRTGDHYPADELFGRSWTARQLDRLLADHRGDEDAIYRAMGLIDTAREQRQPLLAPVTHGTHMLDTAAGHDHATASPALLAARPIIAVQLPAQVAQDRSDAWMPQSLKRALDWILVKAEALSAAAAHAAGRPGLRLPLLVNCSFGSMAGPLDGLSDVERRIAQFVETYRNGGPERLCSVVLSAGNSQVMRATACVAGGAPDLRTPLAWRVQPDDKTPSYVQIWAPPTAADAAQQVRVALVPPYGGPAARGWSAPGQAVQWEIGGIPYARIYHQRVARPGGQVRECITLALRPTADDGIPVPVVPAGVWQILIEPVALPAGAELDLHVHRDDPGLFARGKGRQSYFDDPHYVRFDPVSGRIESDERTPTHSRVKRQRTISAYGAATTPGVVVAGGYRWSDGTPSFYAAAGPARDARQGPDLAAVADESPSTRGILGAGTLSGAVVAINGTSVSAPLATRRLSEIVAGGGGVPQLIAEVQAFEAHPAGPNGPYDPTPRPLRWGAGRLRFVPGHPSPVRSDPS